MAGENNLFAVLVTLFLIVFVAVPLGKKLGLKFPRAGEPGKTAAPWDLLVWIFQNPETRRRISLNIFFILIVYLVAWVPVPGLALDSLSRVVAKVDLPGFLAPPVQFSAFALGLGPFITACILLQFLSLFFPALRRWMFGEPKGRKKLQVATYGLGIAIALVQAYGIAQGLQDSSLLQPSLQSGPWGIALAMASLTAGFVLLLWIAKLSEKYGLGSGIALVVFTSLLRKVFGAGKTLWALKDQSDGVVGLIVFFSVAIGIMIATYVLTQWAFAVSIHKKGGADRYFIPFRISCVGRTPLFFASAVLMFPSVLEEVMHRAHLLESIQLGLLGWAGTGVMVLLILGIAQLYGKAVFSPRRFSELAERFSLEPSEGLGIDPEKFWKRVFAKTLGLSGIFLATVLVLQHLLVVNFGIPHSVALVTAGIETPILVGVFYDWLAQGDFYRKRELSGRKDWEVCDLAGDEMETKLKVAHLEGNGVSVLVQPKRFTWGLPIRTTVDEYRLYVPQDQVQAAASLLGSKV